MHHNAWLSDNYVNEFLVSKETVVLRRWKSETKIGLYQTSYKDWIITVKDLESWRFER